MDRRACRHPEGHPSPLEEGHPSPLEEGHPSPLEELHRQLVVRLLGVRLGLLEKMVVRRPVVGEMPL